MTTMAARGAAGALVREWRQRRRLSQMDLALETGVSTRHLSFVETGRARPSPELLLALAERLEVPIREQNTLNFPEWAGYLLGQLSRLKMLTADPEVSELADEVSRYPNVAALGHRRHIRQWPEEPTLLVPWRREWHGTELAFFSTLTSFGTPRDITLAELAVELFYPADEQTASVLRGGVAG